MAAESTPLSPPPTNRERQPPSVRIIHGTRDYLNQHWRRIFSLALALAAGLTFLSGFYKVENGETAAVLRFGRMLPHTQGPGLHFALPLGIDRVVKARTGEVWRLEISGDNAPELSLLSSDENLIETTLVVQYRTSDLRNFLFATEAPEALVAQVVRSTLVEALAATPVDDVLTSAKAKIQNLMRQEVQQRLDTYRTGITLVAVNLQTVSPPREASNAFRAVSDARAEAAKAQSSARGERDRALGLARGEAEKLTSEATATADSRTQQARGAANRFRSLLKQKQQSPGQTRSELLNTTLQEVLPAARIVILAPGEKIDVHLLPPNNKSRTGIPPGRSFDDR